MAALSEQKLVFQYQTLIRKLKDQHRAEIAAMYKKLKDLEEELAQLKSTVPAPVIEPAVEVLKETRKTKSKPKELDVD